MRLKSLLNIGALSAGILLCAVSLPAQGQSEQEQTPKEPSFRTLPPRSAASEYQAQGTAGMVTIGAEFAAHSVPTPEHTFSSEDYIVVEAGLFGPPGAHTTLARSDFSMRINGKKVASPSEP